MGAQEGEISILRAAPWAMARSRWVLYFLLAASLRAADVTVDDDLDDDLDSDSDESAGPSAAMAEKIGQMKDMGTVDRMKELKDMLQSDEISKAAKSNPEVQKKLAELTAKFKEAGIWKGKDDAPAGGLQDEALFPAVCMGLAIKDAQGSLKTEMIRDARKVAKGKMSQAKAAESDIMRIAAVCMSKNVDPKDVQRFQSGQLTSIPGKYMTKARKEGANLVQELDAKNWAALQDQARRFLESAAKHLPPEEEEAGPPFMLGLLAGVPLLLIFGFLARKFSQMEEKKSSKKEKKEKKKR